MKTNWGAAFQIAAVYIGTVVGAGFATGREIVEFFSRFGFLGLISILISGYLFIFLGAKLMRIAARIQASSYQELNEYLFGKFFGSAINAFMLFMLLGVCAVMLSGAGAVFEEQLGLSKYLGICITIVLSIAVMIMGTKGIFAVNTFVVPLMIGFSVLLLILSMRLPHFMEKIHFIPPVKDGWKVVVAPFSYAAMNLSLAQAVLVPIAAEIKDEKTIKWGGILGGATLTIILLSSHLTLVMLPELESYSIPMGIVMKTTAASFFGIYVLIIYGEIFTSIIGNVYGIERHIRKYISIPSIFTITVIIILCAFVSLIDYGLLLSYLYPFFGYISILFIILLWMKPLKN